MHIVTGTELHREVILEGVLQAERFVWIATADLKDMHVEMARGYRPVLVTFAEMSTRGVAFRILHSKLPSSRFRDSLEKLPELYGGGLELQECPRMHSKLIVVDGVFAYFGSANFTGAGLGPRREARRNLELGAVTRDPETVAQLAALFDRYWIGDECPDCAFRDRCPGPIH